MKTLRRLLCSIQLTLAAWAFLRRWHREMHGGWPVPPAIEPQWEPANAEALAAFLRTESGRVLIGHLRWVDLRTTAWAVHSATNSREFRCGYSAGLRAAVSYLVTLSSPPAAHAGPAQHDDGAAALREELAP